MHLVCVEPLDECSVLHLFDSQSRAGKLLHGSLNLVAVFRARAGTELSEAPKVGRQVVHGPTGDPKVSAFHQGSVKGRIRVVKFLEYQNATAVAVCQLEHGFLKLLHGRRPVRPRCQPQMAFPDRHWSAAEHNWDAAQGRKETM